MHDRAKRKLAEIPTPPIEFVELMKSVGVETGSTVFAPGKESDDVDYILFSDDPYKRYPELKTFALDFSDYEWRTFECFYLNTSPPMNLLFFKDAEDYKAYIKATHTLKKSRKLGDLWCQLLENKPFRVQVFEALVDFQLKRGDFGSFPNYLDELDLDQPL